MRRWLLVFLMALLPLQLSWAAVAAYCQHEQAPAQGAHVGHHEHNHHPDAAAPDGHADAKGSLTVDDDCGTCHLGHAQTLLSADPAAARPALPPRVARQSVLHASHIPALPERPDRRLA